MEVTMNNDRKSVPKLLRRFVSLLLLSSFLIIVLNFIVLAIIASHQFPNGSPWISAMKAAKALHKTNKGYVLSVEMNTELMEQNVWGIFIDNATHQVVWHTNNLPRGIPTEYTISEIASLTRGYIKGYPTFTGESKKGLMVLGYPKDSYWKHMWPSWDYDLIAHFPQTILAILACNVALIFLIYIFSNARLLKSVNPIANGIRNLSSEQPVTINEKGLLSELAASINRTSDILQTQSRQLKKRETARANWIAGVSHDIRTPLAIIMGYAGQLESNQQLTDEERKKAAVILKQSEKMRNLIQDLNLASKLEYNMQPVNTKKENTVAIVRQVVVDFINTDIESKYPIEWLTDENLSSCMVTGDRELLKRGVCNLIQNCINHNENGCTIFVSVESTDDKCIISIEDDGVGVSDKQIEKLNHTPHYMVCDDNTSEQRHGLGLLLVKQIVASHHGEVIIDHRIPGGFSVKMVFPLCKL